MYFSDLQIINRIFCKLFVIYNNRYEKSHRPPRGIISSPGWYYNPGLELLSHACGLAPRGGLLSRVVLQPGTRAPLACACAATAWRPLVPGRNPPRTRGGEPLVPVAMYRMAIRSQRGLRPGTRGLVSTSA